MLRKIFENVNFAKTYCQMCVLVHEASCSVESIVSFTLPPWYPNWSHFIWQIHHTTQCCNTNCIVTPHVLISLSLYHLRGHVLFAKGQRRSSVARPRARRACIIIPWFPMVMTASVFFVFQSGILLAIN